MKKSITKYIYPMIVIIIILLNFFISNMYLKALLGYILIYFTLLGGSIFIIQKWKVKFEIALPINLMILILIMVIFAMFNFLLLGLIVVVLINLLLGLYVVLKKNYDMKKIFLQPSFIFITLLYFFLIVATWSSVFHIWDEYTFWSIASKNVYFSNSFDFGSSSTMTFGGNYGPIPTIFQYFCLKIVGVYRQGIELFASQIMGFIFLLPLFKFSEGKSKIFKIIISLTIMLIPAIFVEGYFYYTIYVDTLLGLITGYCLLELCTNNNLKYTTFITSLSIIILSLIKSSGFMFSISIVCFYCCRQLLKGDYNIKSIFKNLIDIFKEKRVYLFLACIVIPLITWKMYRSVHPIQVSYETTNDALINGVGGAIKTIVKTFTSHNIGQYEESLRNFYSDIIDKAYYSSKPFDLSVGSWISIFIIVSVFLYMLTKNKREKKALLDKSISVFVSFVAYLLLLQFAYISMFSGTEAVLHNSAQRYVGSMLIAIVIFLVSVFFKYIIDSKEGQTKAKILIGFAILLLFTPITSIADGTVMFRIRNWRENSLVSSERLFVSKIENNIRIGESIATIHQGTADTHLLKVIHFATPLKIKNVDKITEENYNEDFFKKYIQKNNFLITVVLDDFIKEKVYNLYSVKLDDWSIYKVLFIDQKYVLVKVSE